MSENSHKSTNSNKLNKKNKESNYLWVLIIVGAFILLIWCLNYYLLESDKERGTFGDMFGAVNALFSGFALAGVIYAILLQRIELRLQREDLAETRDQIEGQKKALEAQHKTMELQQFENTFFHMLSLYNDTLERTIGIRVAIKGKNAIREHSKTIVSNIRKYRHDTNTDSFPNENIGEYFQQYRHRLNAYLNHIQNIIYTINDSEIKNKGFYFNMFKSLLSVEELVLIFYFLHSHNIHGTKSVLEKQAFFDAVKPEDLARESDKNFYKKSAFGK